MIERKKELETLTVIELRELARKLAVKRPMEKSREELICAIIKRENEVETDREAEMIKTEQELLKQVAIYKVALFDACEDVAMLLNADDVCDDEVMVNKLYEKYRKRAARSLSDRGECCGKAGSDKE